MNDTAIGSSPVTFPPASASQPAPVPAVYLDMMRADGHHNPPAFFHATARLFGGIDLRNKRVLEIGSGKGLIALYAALHGAEQVVSLEPEMVGATSGVIALQRTRIAAMNLRNVVVVPADFNSWDPGTARFDVIVSRSSLNHLCPSNRHALKDHATYSRYAAVLRKIRGMMSPGGVFVATDACRYALFTSFRKFGFRRPWRWQRTTVDWRYHQNPSTWVRIFTDAGFRQIEVRYPVPYRLRQFDSLIGTATVNFFLNGTFIVHAS